MKITKKVSKTKAVSTKLTEEQNVKLEALAKKHDMTKSALVAELLEIGYKSTTRNKTF